MTRNTRKKAAEETTAEDIAQALNTTAEQTVEEPLEDATEQVEAAADDVAEDAAEGAENTVENAADEAADETADVAEDAADTDDDADADDEMAPNVTVDYEDFSDLITGAQPTVNTDAEDSETPAAEAVTEPQEAPEADAAVADAADNDAAAEQATTNKPKKATAKKSSTKKTSAKSTKAAEDTAQADAEAIAEVASDEAAEPVKASAPSIASRIDRVIVNGKNDSALSRQYPNFACNKVSLAGAKGRVDTLSNVQFSCYAGHTYALLLTDDEDAGITADTKRKALLSVMTGLVHPTSGAVMNKSANIDEIEPLELRGHRLGIMTQEYAVRPELDAERNVRYAMEASNRNFLKPKPVVAREMLAKVGFNEATSGVDVGTLPDVQQRLAGIARTIANEAIVLILDEPTHGLNEEDTVTVLGTLAKLAHKSNPKYCVIMLTQSREIAEAADQTFEI